ncbi:MAG: protein-L-isoaspartate(D-aspartate) O-methyltransferase [Chloroflexota bacterium]
MRVWRRALLLVALSLLIGPAVAELAAPSEALVPPETQEAEFAAARRKLVESGIVGWGITDEAVIEVMGRVPRHRFVPEAYLDQAYANHPLPIGYGQTISQPYIVALMTQELNVAAGDRVLEIGTGSGYQAAVLAELGVEVFTMEIIEPLADAAAERLEQLGYTSVHVRHGDGYYGWPEEAPFDAIIVTAAPDHVPPPLLAQLRVGGVMVIPVGPVGAYQELWCITRTGEDAYKSVSLGGVSFVPLTRLEAP